MSYDDSLVVISFSAMAGEVTNLLWPQEEYPPMCYHDTLVVVGVG